PPNDLAHQSSAPSHAQRGAAMHTLLQYLPNIAFDERVTIGRRWLAARRYRTADAEPMLDEVFGVLDDPAFAALLAPGSMAEVPVMGTIMVAGEERGVSGVIDRLAITGDIVTVLDYKTARSVPQTTAPTTAITQMALYGALLAPLYPGKSLHTLVLYTAAPKIITVTPEQRADALAALAKL
ncbi:MAG: PD-(D/E)XK nuclease family protein, partial [Pseudomonadota bacterium]